MDFTGSSFRRRALPMAAIALVVVFILWNIPELNIVLFPFRLFVTFIHEAGHGLAAIITGGRFLNFIVNADGSGLAMTAGGTRALILPAGYLSAALFGAVLFFLANSVPYPRQISFVLGVLVIIIAVMFGGILSVATGYGVAIGLGLIAISLKLHADINILVLNLLSMLTSLNAVLDLFFLTGNAGITDGTTRNDALAFQQEIAPLVPANVWAFLWSGLALLFLGLAIYFSIIHPLVRRKQDF